MARESRVKKSLLNARVNMICYFASLVVAFFTRKVFLDYLGAEFIGLTGTLSSLLGFLNLAELGVGTAIGYVLYKPLFDDDQTKINEIISVFGYLYRCIGLFILGAGVILSLFLPLIFPDTSFSWGVIYLGFYAYLAASLLGYFVNYRQTLLSADQRNYEVTGYYQAVVTTKTIVQMVLAFYLQSFVVFLALELVFGVIYSFILTTRINKAYPWLQSDVKLGKQLFKKYPEIGKYVKQLFVHKIGSFVQFQITPFLIYSYVSLPIVALYGNYTIITQRVQGFVSGVMDSTGAGVGNLISEADRNRIFSTYKELFALRFFIAGILSASVFYLGSPFINVWLGAQYVLSDLIVGMVALQMFLFILRGTTDQFINGYGLFYDVWAPLVESGIFILASIVLGHLWGLPGVLCGPLISTIIIIYLWKPYFLFTKGFRLPYRSYWKIFLIHAVALGVSVLVTNGLMTMVEFGNLQNGWIRWILLSLIYVCILTVVAFALFYLFSSGMRCFVGRFIKAKKQKNG